MEESVLAWSKKDAVHAIPIEVFIDLRFHVGDRALAVIGVYIAEDQNPMALAGRNLSLVVQVLVDSMVHCRARCPDS